jgi:hypothetical protein
MSHPPESAANPSGLKYLTKQVSCQEEAEEAPPVAPFLPPVAVEHGALSGQSPSLSDFACAGPTGILSVLPEPGEGAVESTWIGPDVAHMYVGRVDFRLDDARPLVFL